MKKPYKFEVFQSKPFGPQGTHDVQEVSYDSDDDRKPYDHWFWRCRAGNNKIVADGSEGYTTRSGAVRALRRFLGMMNMGRYQV